MNDGRLGRGETLSRCLDWVKVWSGRRPVVKGELCRMLEGSGSGHRAVICGLQETLFKRDAVAFCCRVRCSKAPHSLFRQCQITNYGLEKLMYNIQ